MSEKVHLDDGELRELMHLMSHDVRNPLAAIVTNLEFAKRLVSRMNLDPDLVDSIEDSVTACDVLRRIVSNFDLLVRGRDYAITLTRVNVGTLVSDVVRRCDARAQQASLTIEADTGDKAVTVSADKTMLALALENLVANAIQHAPRGSNIKVALSTSADKATICVHDEGIAIKDALTEKALGAAGHTPSGRVDGTRYGRGLGLLSAHAAARANGIDLVVGGIDGASKLELHLPIISG